MRRKAAVRKKAGILFGTLCLFLADGLLTNIAWPMEAVSAYAGGEALPDAYDGRDYGLITPPKWQEPYEACWAFAVTAAEEANLIKSGLADQDADLSEYHLAYFQYRETEDPLGNLAEDISLPGDELSFLLNYGGSLESAAGQHASWYGPVEESLLPYSEARQGKRPVDGLAYQADYHLKKAVFADANDREEIKELVLRYGAVAVSYYQDALYYSYEDGICSYYLPKVKGANHAVCLIGWDDRFPREHFGVMPPEDGAWLCKSSGGIGVPGGDGEQGGYLWISYDVCLSDALAVELEAADVLQNNYQYDGYANEDAVLKDAGFSEDEAIAGCMNVFRAKKSGTFLESLEAVSIRASRSETYGITVYADPVFAGQRLTGWKSRSQTVSFTAPYDGIYRIRLAEPLYLAQGDRFGIEVRGKHMEQFAASALPDRATGCRNEGKCYVCIRKEGVIAYEDLAQRSEPVTPRIKAFTNPTDIPCAIKSFFVRTAGKEISWWSCQNSD